MKDDIKPIQQLLVKLENSLKGSALMLKMSNDTMYTPEEKLAEMKAIEELTHYIRDYYKNKDMIEKYQDMQRRLIDDGR